jgi:hypothetical protein
VDGDSEGSMQLVAQAATSNQADRTREGMGTPPGGHANGGVVREYGEGTLA